MSLYIIEMLFILSSLLHDFSASTSMKEQLAQTEMQWDGDWCVIDQLVLQ